MLKGQHSKIGNPFMVVCSNITYTSYYDVIAKLSIYLFYVRNRFRVAICLCSNRSQVTSKCGKNKKNGTNAVR